MAANGKRSSKNLNNSVQSTPQKPTTRQTTFENGMETEIAKMMEMLSGMNKKLEKLGAHSFGTIPSIPIPEALKPCKSGASPGQVSFRFEALKPCKSGATVLVFRSFRNQNRSQKNTVHSYSGIGIDGIVPIECALDHIEAHLQTVDKDIKE